jgi:hypothetical protein
LDLGTQGENDVRTILILPLLALGACDVDNDSANNQVSVTFDKEAIRDAREEAGAVASGVGNVASSTGRAIKDEVGDIDVDVDVSRNRSRDSETTNKQ